MLICDLIDAIKPGSIQYSLLKTTGTAEVKSIAKVELHLEHDVSLIILG